MAVSIKGLMMITIDRAIEICGAIAQPFNRQLLTAEYRIQCPRVFRVGFVDRNALGPIAVRVLRPSPAIIIPLLFQIHLRIT
jgi:hypothetical protein